MSDCVEVIRCENCKYWQRWTPYQDGTGFCYQWAHRLKAGCYPVTEESGYCSYAKRRDAK